MRLRNTIVLYDDEPYYVLTITNHKSDGIFRLYLEPVGKGEAEMSFNILHSSPKSPPSAKYPWDWNPMGENMDKWMEANPDMKIQRKVINSPSFNRFRPFPLGMLNDHGKAVYTRRRPTRKSEQGLIYQMVDSSLITLTSNPNNKGYGVDIYGEAFYDCITGQYPTLSECLEAFDSDDILNTSVAFHREFALIKGPIRTAFLNYRGDVIGFVNKKSVQLSPQFRHLKEAVEDLNEFEVISILTNH